jgi:hypothetical protein
LQTRKNISLLKKINQLSNTALIDKSYRVRLETYLSAFRKIRTQNEKYFETFGGFKAGSEVLANLTNLSIDQAASALSQDAVLNQFSRPVKDILTRNVTTGAQFSDLQDQLKDFILGTPEVDGKWLRYTKQITHDALFNYSRAYQETVAEQLGLRYYRYVGGLKKDSRPFCVARNGKFFSKSQIESWASEEWKGKAAGTTPSSIFMLLGGYNCRHSLIPVDESAVPNSVKESNS